MTPEFAAIAWLKFEEATAAGEALCDHCLTCGKCEHMGDDDLSVKMCGEAKLLNVKWELLMDDARPYLAAMKKERDEQTGQAE